MKKKRLESTTTIDWLKRHSMLLRHAALAQTYSGQSTQWQHSFGRARPQPALETNSIWFAAYPDSLIGQSGLRALDILGSTELQQLLSDLGIDAIHTGPMKRSGSVRGSQYGSSIDGHFDRIECAIDPDYGTEDQYRNMVSNAATCGLVIIGDLIPGHTGMGPDFRLATINEPGFASLYTMIEVQPDDWSILPAVPEGQDSANLSQAESRALKQQGYHPVGPLDIEVFARPGIKDSCWSATDVVHGVDGKDRRWVYLHIFKQGQPSLNWSDPGYAAHRLITADLLHSMTELGVKGLRLDATMFLGIEADGTAKTNWLGGHPLSNRVTDQLSLTIRKFGGFSFQELNTDLGRLGNSLEAGPEFNYDFVTRPCYLYAVAKRDGGPLRLILREMLNFDIQPSRLVHGLQNHDELMLETTHLSTNSDKIYEYEGHRESGASLFRRIHEEVLAATTANHAHYNRPFAMSPGVCSTMPGFIAAVLGIRDIDQIDTQQIEEIARVHLLAAAFNALQGGVFLISGWDLVGALPVSAESVKDLVADNDYRWINRGGYDLLGTAESVDHSVQGLPRAKSLYGSLPEQIQNPNSFCSRLKSLLEVRKSLGISRSELTSVPVVDHAGAVMLVNTLPDQPGARLITALNFSRETLSQRVHEPGIKGTAEIGWSNLQSTVAKASPIRNNSIDVDLLPLEAKLVVVRS